MSTESLPQDLTGPGSPLYEVLSDGSTLYAILPGFLFVVLDAVGGQGVDDHDRVAKISARSEVRFEDIITRLSDTVDFVIGIIFSGEERPLVAHAIYELHRHIEGKLLDGTKYHAWNKDIWAWTWAGILKPIMDVHQELRGFKSEAFRQDVYTGLLQVGALFNVRGLPKQYSDFEVYWQKEWIPLLQSETESGRFIAGQIRKPAKPRFAPWIPTPIWQLTTWPLRNVLWAGYFMAAPPEVDKVLNITRTRGDRISMKIHRTVWRFVPHFMTHHWISTYFALRFKYGTPVWRSHYSRESLEQYRLAMKKAKADGTPFPPRPSARNTKSESALIGGCPMGHGTTNSTLENNQIASSQTGACPMGHGNKKPTPESKKVIPS